MPVSFIFDDRIRLAEFARNEEREQAAKLALEAYKASYKHAAAIASDAPRPSQALMPSCMLHPGSTILESLKLSSTFVVPNLGFKLSSFLMLKKNAFRLLSPALPAYSVPLVLKS